ncbi:hypothetical protein ACF0H5_003953 [Mactra antiquata]
MLKDFIYVVINLSFWISVCQSVDANNDYTCELLYKHWSTPDRLTVTWTLHDDDDDDDDDGGDDDVNAEDVQTNVTWYKSHNFGSCPETHLTKCVWHYIGSDFYFYDSFNLLVIITNKTTGHIIHNRTFDIEPYDNCIKPPTVDEFTVSVINSTCVNTTWSYSKSSKCFPFDTKLYRLSYTTSNASFESKHPTRESINVTTSSCESSRVICKLHPFTTYIFNIQTKWIDDSMNGHFSDNITLAIKTLEQAPSKSPDLIEGGWTIINNTCKDIGQLTDISEADKNGVLQYFLMNVNDGTTEDEYRISGDYYNRDISLGCQRGYRIRLQGVNDAGSSPWSNSITIPAYQQDKLDVINHVIPILDPRDKTFHVYWLPYVSHRTYRVFWCIKHNKRICQTPVQWSTIINQDTYKTIPITPGTQSYQYSIGVSTNNDEGIIWTDCIYSNSEVTAPKNVKMETNDKLPDGYVIVRWLNMACSETLPQAFIKQFHVFICEVRAAYDQECQKPYDKVVVVNGRRDKYMFQNLTPGSIYKVQIRSEGLRDEMSSLSKPVYGQVIAHGTSLSAIFIVFIILGCMIVISGTVCCVVATKRSLCRRWKKYKDDNGRIQLPTQLQELVHSYEDESLRNVT